MPVAENPILVQICLRTHDERLNRNEVIVELDLGIFWEESRKDIICCCFWVQMVVLVILHFAKLFYHPLPPPSTCFLSPTYTYLYVSRQKQSAPLKLAQMTVYQNLFDCVHGIHINLVFFFFYLWLRCLFSIVVQNNVVFIALEVIFEFFYPIYSKELMLEISAKSLNPQRNIIDVDCPVQYILFCLDCSILKWWH